MGVKGLTTIVKDDPRSTKYFRLHDTNLVIDGCALEYYLYARSSHGSRDAQYSGDYISYARTITNFFSTLKRCNIFAHVIIDGGMDPSEIKFETILERMRSRLSSLKRVASGYQDNLLPIHATRVFFDVLKEIDVKVVRSVFEADGDVAMVGNILGCPVVSNDSDFYIFDLKHGYIPLETIGIRDVQTYSDGSNFYKYIECEKFDTSYFLTPHPGLKPEMLPLLSCLIGNDYIQCDLFRNICANNSDEAPSLKQRTKRMLRLLNWLTGKSLEEAKKIAISQSDKDLRQSTMLLLNRTIDLYSRATENDPCPVNHLYHKECDSNHSQMIPPGFTLSDNVIVGCMEGLHDHSLLNVALMNKVLLNPQSEHFSLPSSYSSARKLIIYYCSLLRQSEDIKTRITVYERNDANIGQDSFEVWTNFPDGHHIPCITSLNDLTVQESRHLLLKFLDISVEMASEMESMLSELHLDEGTISMMSTFVYVLNYSIDNSEETVTIESVLALILCLLYYEVVDTFQKNKCIEFKEKQSVKSTLGKFTKKPSSSYLDTRIVHFNSQFQAVTLFFSRINRLLKMPIADVPVHRFLNGVLYYNLVLELRKSADPLDEIDKLLCVQGMKMIFFKIFDLMNQKCNRMKEMCNVKRNTKKVMSKIRKTPVKIVPVNKFSLLTLRDD